MTNYRAPPDQLARTQLNQVSSWCRYDPAVCLAEVSVETAFLAVGYCAILFLTASQVPSLLDILRFVFVFATFSVAARMLSDDLGNKLSISAISGIGSKCVAILAPRFVGW